MKNTKSTKAVKANAPKTAKVRDVSVSFDEFIALRGINSGYYNAKPAEKDVYAGIQKVKSQPLIVTPESINLIKEIRSYKWKVDKDGKVHSDEQPVKMWDHLCDAMRYAIYTKLNKPKFEVMAW